MTAPRFRNAARYWRSPLVPDADMVTAEYYDHAFTPHWHDAYTVPVIEAGAECYDYRGAHHVAEAGSVPVINPGEVHTGARAVDSGWRYRVFYLPVPFVEGLACELSPHAPSPWFAADIIRDDDLARRLLRAHRALESLTSDAARADPLAAETALVDAVMTLLARHARERPSCAPPAADAVRVATMKSRLADDLLEPVTLAELARTVGLSTFHAARLFTRETGLAPHAWRNQLRIARALPALRAGASVAHVAAASGFTDQSHFTRHFKRAFGVAPGRWR
ncbi:AraC family transcriptional regulator [Caballeronia sp. LZ062]|uniref:AraC family transcriptional regulator n=1 Tax=unclassified Caballeronia TaxID=2646786 RepID=UPI002865E9E3|nr:MULTISPECIES: AraC family transcriptional regulator [unclassified Caballeronia]MDR5855043.1 AraC family transcriptional regulator [Caballeronia sp. LZ050]MDR5870428.1 AraC family transcriptional regulator [Caballeronia sp. LZ062]